MTDDQPLHIDPDSTRVFGAITAVIAEELNVSAAGGEDLNDPNEVEGRAECIADAVLDRFKVLERRPNDPHYHWGE
jgi:hypothetical protein